MDWWEYLHPDNPVSSKVVAALTYGFYVWLLLLIAKIGHLVYQRWQMSRLKRVRPLRDELARRAAPARRFGQTDESNVLELPGEAGEALVDDEVRVREVFDDFCRGVGVWSRSVIAGHVRSVFTAGWKSSQLQIDALTRHTSNRLFRFNGVLRSVLALVFCAGVVVTLLGLAASLAQLSPLMSATAQGQQLNGVVGQGLRDLLRELKGAFAPSIWGVIYTIAGVTLFAAYSYFCRYVKDVLDGLTQDVWVADLYPSTFQQQLMSLVQTEELIRKNREHVELVAEVAREIRPDMARLQQRVAEANVTLASLTDTSTRIGDFADTFRDGVLQLVPFQKDLRDLYERMKDDSAVFQETVRASVGQSASFQQQAGAMLTRQGEQIAELLRALDSYETAYVEARRAIDAKLVEVLDQAKDAYQQLGARNEDLDRAIRESLADPLRKDLGDKLSEVHTTLETKLAAVVSRFGTFDAPIQDSARDIRLVAQAIVSQADKLTGQLRHEYLEQGRKNRGQLESLAGLSHQLAGLLTQFAEAGRVQEQSTGSLKDATVALGRRLDALAGKLDAAASRKPAEDGGADMARVERLVQAHANAVIRELRELGNTLARDGYGGAARGQPGSTGQRVKHDQHRHTSEREPFARATQRGPAAPDERGHGLITHDLTAKGAERAADAHADGGLQGEAGTLRDDAPAEPKGAAPGESVLAAEDSGLAPEEPELSPEEAGAAGETAAEREGRPVAFRTEEEGLTRRARVSRWFGRTAGAVKRTFWKGE